MLDRGASSFFLWLTIVCLALVTLPAHALYNEEMVLAGGPEQGVTLSFTPTGGEPVAGTVKEDEEGRRFVAFPLSGNGPSSGVVTATSAAGTQHIEVPARDDDEEIVLDLSAGTATVASTASAIVTGDSLISDEKRWEFSIGVNGVYAQSDFFKEILSDQELVLDNLLTDSGVTEIGTRSSADDDAYGWGIDASVFYRICDSGNLYTTLGYFELEDFKGSATGTGVFGPSNVGAIGSGKIELEFVTLSVGYEHIFTDAFRGYAGLGVISGSMDESTSASLSQDGTIISETSGGSKDDGEEAFIEAGVRYLIGLSSGHALGLELGVIQTDEMIAGESFLILDAGINYRF